MQMNLNDENEPSRVEKLAAAKKKLKHYQHRHKYSENVGGNRVAEFEISSRPLSSAYSGCSTESLAESSKSVGVKHHQHNTNPSQDFPKRYSASSLPIGTSVGPNSLTEFHHDESRSPFQRIKRPSGSSECSSAVVSSNFVERHNHRDEKFQETEAMNYLRTQNFDEENGCGLDDADALNSNKLALVIDFHNSDHSVYENNNAANVTSAHPSVAYPTISSTSKPYSDSNRNWPNPNIVSESSSTSARAHPHIIEANSADYMPSTNFQNVNDNRLQKIFDDIQPNIDAVNYSLNLNPNMISPDTGEQMQQLDSANVFSENYFPASINNENAKINNIPPSTSTDNKYSQNNFTAASNNDSSENAFLLEQNQQLQTYCHQVSAQLHELNSHYAQLHQAYSSLSAEHNAKSNMHAQHLMMAMNQQTENQTDLHKQIHQHVQTMSVLVEEKSALQSQLRQAMDIANKEHLENEELTGRLKANRDRLSLLEKDLDTCSSVKSAIETTLQRQSLELERVRKESAQFQAKTTDLLQDKSELSSRLKLRSREVDDFMGKIRDLEKQMHMKDIYIQQLTGGQQIVMVDEMERIRVENQRLQSESIEYRQLAERFRQDAEQSKERYESYGRQLNLKIVELSGELEKSANDRIDLENKFRRAEQEFQDTVVSSKNAALSSASSANSNAQQQNSYSGVDLDEFLNLKEGLSSLKEECQILLNENSKLQSSLVEKQKLMESLELDLKDKDSKISRLEEFLNTNDQTNLNVQGLLEQLHNEKATSSRAVAQNLALKVQLVEIEDKFVSVTQNEMDMATKLQTAEHAVQSLTAQLAEKDDKFQQQLSEEEEKYNKLKSEVNNIMKQEYDRTQFEDRLHHYDVVQKANQTELDSCKEEINRLNVENAYLQQNLTLLNEKLQNSSHENHEQLPLSNLPLISKEDLTVLQSEISHNRQRIDHLTRENAELHRIMEQNAADENQNTIHVELGQAVERMTYLSRDNEELRNSVNEINNQLSAANDEIVHLNSVIEEEGNMESGSFDNMKKAMEQLQARFTRAITENADLTDHNEQLEHLIMQLQNETETIGEYVTLYQHQRKIIRDRLREKEDYVARLSREKQEVQGKLSELQHLVMHLLKEKGALRSYAQFPPTHAKPPRSPPSKMPERPRNLSETLVDETSRSVSPAEMAIAALNVSESTEEMPVASHDLSQDAVSNVSDSSPPMERVHFDHGPVNRNDDGRLFEDTSPTAERILKLLVEMQRPDLVNNLPPTDRSLHCKYCTGKLLML